jgi:asparagine synthase (glutamine-hydrolysing)
VAAAFSLEPRYPFYDRRLVEFCLALPGEQKLRWGWSRFILRQAMAGTLPERVRRRGGKTNLSAQFNEGFLAFERERIEAVVHGGSQTIAPFVDMEVLRELYQEVLDRGKTAECRARLASRHARGLAGAHGLAPDRPGKPAVAVA